MTNTSFPPSVDLAAVRDWLASGSRVALYIRHAERPPLQADDPTFGESLGLTQAGERQARAFGAALRGVVADARLLASPMTRTRRTVQLIAEGAGLGAGRPVEDAPEIGVGNVFTDPAGAHRANAPRLEAAGIQAVDLTPAALGPFTVPVVNLGDHLAAPNVNLISCGGQATIPMVAAVSRVTAVPYAEIVASVSSASAGPGTRANIDEFTQTTARGVELVGGAERGRAIIILNPADPPLLMRNTVFAAVEPDADRDAIAASIEAMAAEVAQYVPGYRMTAPPQFDEPREGWDGRARVTVLLEVEGAGDFLPRHAGNLDVMTAAAAAVGERLAAARLGAAA